MPILFRRLIFVALCVVFGFQGVFALAAGSAGDNTHKLRGRLKSISKLQDQKSALRVIVGLEISAEEAGPANWKSDANIKRLREKIRGRQTDVLSFLSISEFKPRHCYKNFASFSGMATIAGLNKLVNNPLVKSVELVERQQPLLAQGISLMNADVPRINYNGQGVSIAISDTGVDYGHPMLGNGPFPNSKVIGGYDAGGTTSVNHNDPDSDPFPYGPNPDSGHGTNCAGIAAGNIGAVGDYVGGVAHNARIYALKISADDDNSAWSDDIIDAWDWCVTHKDDDPANPILIISHSFGGGKYLSAASGESASPSFASAANNVVAAGITIFASSGNDGYCDSLSLPAAFSSVISVGAVYDASFGTYYPCIDAESCADKISTTQCTGWYAADSTFADMVTSYSNAASFLDILAPSNQAYTTDITGVDGYSTGDYEPDFGGTSAACPYAAGAAACLQSAAKIISGSYLTPSELKNILVSSGDGITDSKVFITKPRVNLAAAIASLISPPQAFDVPVTTVYNTPVTITLQATDDGVPDPLGYTITSLVNHGVLSEPNGLEIAAVPYTLASNGNEVVYTPRLNCGLGAAFEYLANDGGTAPDGGDSNLAVVTVSIVDLGYFADMDSDPGWTFGGSYWAWGVPSGAGGANGNADPAAGYTGSNVIGYNLLGDYRRIRLTEWAMTPAIDCRAMTNVILSFYRWLNVGAATADHAYIEVSNDGAVWNAVWENSAEITDSSWTLQTYDISAFADGQQAVYVRWGMGLTDNRYHYSGWNIDDVKLLAANPVQIDGDLDSDCQVNSDDLIVMANNWLKACPQCDGADITGDGTVDLGDLLVLAQNWLN